MFKECLKKKFQLQITWFYIFTQLIFKCYQCSINFNRFNHDLSQKLWNLSKENQNVFFSPLSISTALSMLLLGSDGETQQQIEKALGVVKNETFLYNLKMLNELLNIDEDYLTIKIANCIFPDKSFVMLETYLEDMKRAFNCKISTLDYKNDANNCTNVINRWVEASTNENINDVVKFIYPKTACILVSCIYFEGKWLDHFKKSSTVKNNFYCSNNSISTVNMMSKVGTFLHTHDIENKFQCVKLFYKPPNFRMPPNFYMLVILPNDRFGVDEVAKQLDAEKIRNLTKKANFNFSERRVDLKLPKFKLSYEVGLNDAFKLLGITDAFDENSADFSGMSADALKPDGRLHVKKAVHKAFIDVDEVGTVAAAATYCKMWQQCAAKRKIHPFVVDHQFIFLIQHKQQTLFMGKINSL